MVKFDTDKDYLEIGCDTVEKAEETARHFNQKKAIAWVRIRPFGDAING